MGFYDILRLAGPVMILAPILGAIGLTLVTLSHLIPIVMGYERVPTYLDADPGGHATLAATALVTNAAGKPQPLDRNQGRQKESRAGARS